MSIQERIKQIIIERLELTLSPEDFDENADLFGPALTGGLALDSLAALEIVVALSEEYGLQLDEVPREAFQTVATLSNFIENRLEHK